MTIMLFKAFILLICFASKISVKSTHGGALSGFARTQLNAQSTANQSGLNQMNRIQSYRFESNELN